MESPTLTNPKPTKAAVEFDGDCFGRLFSKKAPECDICMVAVQCRRVCKGLAPEKESKEPREDKENAMPVMEKTKKAPEKAKKLAKQYLKDKKNCGFREGTAGWGIYQVLREGLHDRVFTADELKNKSKIFCKEEKISCHTESKVPVMLKIFRDLGLIVKIDKEEYKKVI